MKIDEKGNLITWQRWLFSSTFGLYPSAFFDGWESTCLCVVLFPFLLPLHILNFFQNRRSVFYTQIMVAIDILSWDLYHKQYISAALYLLAWSIVQVFITRFLHRQRIRHEETKKALDDLISDLESYRKKLRGED